MALDLMPCPWPVQRCGPLPEEDAEEYKPLHQAASEILWALSGRQFGCCEGPPIRPCREDCLPLSRPGPLGPYGQVGQWTPVLSDGQWINLTCRQCAGGRCSCPEVSEVLLPGPVCEVIEVTIDGTAVPTGSYRIDDLAWLVRQSEEGGEGSVRPSWPLCQDMGAPLGSEDTWGVRYRRGTPVPSGGQRALGEMMSEIWKGCNNDSSCALPKRVRTIVKQGLTVAVLDPMAFLEKGKTGLYFTDLWLQAVNPLARPAGARVISPDWEPGRTTTWP